MRILCGRGRTCRACSSVSHPSFCTFRCGRSSFTCTSLIFEDKGRPCVCFRPLLQCRVKTQNHPGSTLCIVATSRASCRHSLSRRLTPT